MTPHRRGDITWGWGDLIRYANLNSNLDLPPQPLLYVDLPTGTVAT